MTVGDFYKRHVASGSDFEVVLRHGEDRGSAMRELEALHIAVRDDAAIGDFTIHLDDPLDWAKVGAVICGEIFGDPFEPDDQSSGASDANARVRSMVASSSRRSALPTST